MFCQKCGEKLPDGAKFCKACGEKVSIKGRQDLYKHSSASAKKNISKKGLLIGAAVLCAVLAVMFIANIVKRTSDSKEKSAETHDQKNNRGGFDSYEAAVDAFFTGAFSQDPEAVISCFPTEMQSDLIQRYNSFRSGDYNNSTDIFRFTAIGTDHDWAYEIKGITELDKSEQEEFQSKYGINIDDGYTVNASMDRIKHYVDDPMYGTGDATNIFNVTVKVAEIGKSWYLIEPVSGDSWWID